MERKNNKKIFIIILVILFSILLVLLFGLLIYNKEPIIKKYNYANHYNDDKTLDVTIDLKNYNNDPIYCKFIIGKEESDWIKTNHKKCTYNIKTGDYIIKIKYNKDKVIEYKKKFNIDKVISIKINEKRKYVAVGGSFNINAFIDYVGDVDTSITYISSNPDIISINETGDIYANSDGKVTISAKTSNNLEDKFELTSTSLIRPRLLNNDKEIVGCNVYTKEQVDMLDDILNSEVEKAGPGTRAGVVAAATFLPMEFPYKIPYFYENGRLSDTERTVDGEGRWYHKGLYLGVDKQNEVKNVLSGPSSWGCSLMNWFSDGTRSPGEYYPNGFDCSGYVAWILKNGGLDPGDRGAGVTGIDDMTDLGELKYINYDLLHSGSVKPGDLIGWDGHIAVIAWITDTDIYVTESLLPGVVLDQYDISSPYSRFYYRYEYIIDMSNQYSGDGNYPNIWR
jgi:hypothetical protein